MRFHYHLLNMHRVVVTQLETEKQVGSWGGKNQCISGISSSSILDVTLIYWRWAAYSTAGALPKDKR